MEYARIDQILLGQIQKLHPEYRIEYEYLSIDGEWHKANWPADYFPRVVPKMHQISMEQVEAIVRDISSAE